MRNLAKQTLAMTLIAVLVLGLRPAGILAAGETAGRSVISFNNDWLFYKGEWPEGQDVDADDSQWLYVNTPHSTIHYTPENYYHEDLGVYWYRRHFTVDAAMEGRQMILTFEGAMQEATVWLNGQELGVHQGGYTQFAFDITDHVLIGEENVLAVRLDTRPNTSYAPGKDNPDFQYFGGIYRDVYLTVTDPVYITDPIESDTVAGGGVFLTAPAVSQDSATVNAKTEVENTGASAADVTLRTQILDGQTVVATREDRYTIPAGEKYTFTQDLTVEEPKLWSLNAPELYTVRSTVVMDGAEVDLVDTTYGIRKVEWKRDGFYLNGEKTELVGVNLHSETYMLGNAQSDDAIFAEIKRLREHGFNFVRMAHYPHDPAFYEACDRYGVAVLDCLAGWQYFNSSSAFRASCEEQMRDQIRVNRNRASVVAWEPSLNESGYDATFAQTMHALVKEEYPEVGDSKAYTGGWMHWGYFDIGVGTPQANVVGDAEKYPDKPVVVSEYGDWNFGGFDSTTRVTREPAHYADANGGDEGMLIQCDNIQSSFAFNRGQSWYGATAYWQYADYAGFDVDKLTFCGVVDVARIPKFSAYFFRSQTDPYLDMSAYGLDTGPMVFIANTWAADSPDQVRVFSNCDQVELYYNDTLIAKQDPDTQMWAPHGDTSNPTGYPVEGGGAYVSTENLAHPPFTFDLSGYTPGEGTLKAVAYLDGQEVATFVRQAPGAAAQITLTVEDDLPLKLDGSTAKLVWVDVRDANGNVVNTADDTITFTTEGPGFVIGEKAVAVRGGQWAVWVRSTRGQGDIVLKATGEGLTEASVTIKTEAVAGLPEAPAGGDADEMDYVAPTPPANIFLNKTASASSVNTAGTGMLELASYANDGDESTKWCAKDPSPSDAFGTHWWQADLGVSYTVETMQIVFDAAGSWRFHIAVSDDPDFTGYQIPDEEILTTENMSTLVQVNKSGRYVRLYVNCPASTLWPCLREVSGTGYSDDLALNKPATASSGTGIELAVDGDRETFWNSQAMSPAWYQVDLGEVYKLSSAVLTFAWADPDDKDQPVRHSFTIQGSMDGVNWYDMAAWSDMEQNDNEPNVTVTVELGGAARYVKVADLWAKLAGTTNQWAEIAALEVYGKKLGVPARPDYGAASWASSSAEGSDAAYGNDGDPAKYWIPASDDPAPAWYFDADGLYDLYAVELYWNTENAHRYAIDISTDGENWTTVADHLDTASPALKTTTDAFSGLARYVRVRLPAGTTDGFWIKSTGFVKDPALTVESVEKLDGAAASVGTPFDDLVLPQTVMVTLEGDVRTPLEIVWDATAYDSAATDPQTITGTLEQIPGTIVPEGTAVTVTVTLEPIPVHTVTFETNGGSAIAGVEVAQGQKLTAPADPTREGHKFLGWYMDAALTQVYDFEAPVTGDLILYAKWEEVHVHTAELVGKKDATCAEEGYTGDLVCTGCGEVLEKGSAISKLEHTTKLVGKEDPTCTQKGYTGDLVCTGCGKLLERGVELPMLEHNYEDGHCTACGGEDPDYVEPTVPTDPDDDPPQTGDLAYIGLLISLIFSAAVYLAWIVLKIRRIGETD